MEIKNKKYKVLLMYGIWTVVLTALVFSLGFVSKKENQILAKTLSIDILNDHENLFLNEKDVQMYFDQRQDKILGQAYDQLGITELEKALNSHPAIENAEVSATLNGAVNIAILQRQPVVRVINKNGESYYIDRQSKLMPLNENYSANVIVANGEFNEPYDRRSMFSVDQIAANEKFSEISILDDILAVGRYIESDTLLRSMFHQIYVNKAGELELFPVVGCHRIVFGSSVNLDEKFRKLKLFYKQGMNKTDNWNSYSSLNLKYKNMVVCTKK